MGIWSRPLFTNCPEWKVNLGWFTKENNCSILLHYSILAENDEIVGNLEVPLGEFVEERIHEHSKIMGHLSTDQLRGWNAFFDLLIEHNKERDTNIEKVSIHLYNIDDEFPYQFLYTRLHKRLMIISYPPGNVYYCSLKRDREEGSPETDYIVVKFDEKRYKKNFKHTPSTNMIDVTSELEAPVRRYKVF